MSSFKSKTKLFLSLVISLLMIFLTGCVDYDLGINFDNQHHGTIVQHIKLGKQVSSFSKIEAQELLTSLSNRVKQLQGETKNVSSQEIIATIPFSNGQELVTKFNKFLTFNSQDPKIDIISLLHIKPKITLQQSNFLIFERDKLILNLDLSYLGVPSEQGNLIVSPGSLIDLAFSLHTPWGVHIIQGKDFLQETTQAEQVIWQLNSGELNYIEVVFWLPSPLGIGTIGIIFLMILGFYGKYKRLPLIYSKVS